MKVYDISSKPPATTVENNLKRMPFVNHCSYKVFSNSFNEWE